MNWAPDSQASWTVFAVGMVALYTVIIFLNTSSGVVYSVAYGGLIGTVMAAIVWAVITLWRAITSTKASPE